MIVKFLKLILINANIRTQDRRPSKERAKFSTRGQGGFKCGFLNTDMMVVLLVFLVLTMLKQ